MNLLRQTEILFERRAGDQTVQVIQRNGKRELRFGNQIIQSAMSESRPDHLLLEYTQAMMTGFALAQQSRNSLQIGLGAGAIARFIHRHFPDCAQDVVELFPDVIEAASRYFNLPTTPNFRIIEDDGQAYVRRCEERYDLIFQDAFMAEGVAGHLQTRSYFQDLRALLLPGGWLVNNTWGSNKRNLRMVATNLSAVFPQLYSISVGVGTNVIFFAGPGHQSLSLRNTLQQAEAITERIPFSLVRWVRNIQRVRQPEDGPLAEPLARIL